MSKETNPIAELNAEMWVVINLNGTMLINTLSEEFYTSWGMSRRLYSYIGFKDSLEQLKEKGYRCIPVSVNIKPIDNG